MAALLLVAVAYRFQQLGPTQEDPALSDVTYDAWDEVVRIDFRTRSIRHDVNHFKYADDMSGNPISRTTETVLADTVTGRDLHELERMVLSTDLMALNDRYGAPPQLRAYVERIAVTTRAGRDKRVEYRSNPSFDKPPESYLRVKAHLLDLSQTVRARPRASP